MSRAHVLPAVERFACCGCGACCKGWSVPVDEETYARHRWMEETPPPEVGVPPFERGADGAVRTRTRDGRCVFLEADGRCFLHRRFGAEAKPRVCRSYPVLYEPTPGGWFGSLSPSCHTAAGLLLAERPRLEETESPLPPAAADPILLSEGRPLGWPAYLDVEATLLSILDRPGPVEDRVIDGSAFLHEATSGDTAEAAARWRDPARTGPRPRPYLPLQREILGRTWEIRLAHMTDVERAEGGLARHAALAREALGAEEASSAAYRAALARRWAPGRPAVNEACARWLRALLLAKRDARLHGLAGAWRNIGLRLALARTAAIALAARSGRAVGPGDVAEAVHRVERDFTHTPSVTAYWAAQGRTDVARTPEAAAILLRV